MTNKSRSIPPSTWLILSAFCLALGSVAARGLVSGVYDADVVRLDPLTFLVCQLAGSVLFLATSLHFLGKPWPDRALLCILAIPGFILGIASIATIFALRYTTASEASVIFAMQPILILMIAWIVLRETLTYRFAIVALVAVFGVIMIVASDVEGGEEFRLLGNLFAFLSTAGAAYYVVHMRRVSANADPLASLIVVQGISLIIVVLAWLVVRTGATNPGVGNMPAYLSAAATGVCYYGVAFLAYLFGLRHIPAGRAGLYLNLVPVFTILLATALLDERFTSTQWMGVAIIITAVAMTSWDSSRNRERAVPD